ncbi:MAG: MCE family protein [Gammaproteobacteria bacterium]|nr:MCE family protein [Gammaproteobacteria bacterium]
MTADEDGIVEATQRRSTLLSFAVVMPLLAVAIAGWLVYRALPERGPVVEVGTADAEGLEAGRSLVRHRGVVIGTVDAIRLAPDLTGVLLTLALEPGMDAFARRGARYWVVRPTVGMREVSGLGTLVAGRYVQAEAGRGAAQTRFTALAEAPLTDTDSGDLVVVLRADSADGLGRGTDMLYRGVRVGVIRSVTLDPDGTGVRLEGAVGLRHARIVRANSVFWVRGGLNVSLGLFKGIELDANSLQSLVSGAIQIATPEPPGAPVASGAIFSLADSAPSGWARWRPRLHGGQSGSAQSPPLPPPGPAPARP